MPAAAASHASMLEHAAGARFTRAKLGKREGYQTPNPLGGRMAQTEFWQRTVKKASVFRDHSNLCKLLDQNSVYAGRRSSVG